MTSLMADFGPLNCLIWLFLTWPCTWTVCSPHRLALICSCKVVLLTCQHDVVGVQCRNHSRSADSGVMVWPQTLANIVASWHGVVSLPCQHNHTDEDSIFLPICS
ncbi:hypothetical protein BGW80DRAFT_1305127 [Lactifluus volemus]|nr:hypothetical protein BGW80DRAFT_1305127 [Lactifluus volemus]